MKKLLERSLQAGVCEPWRDIKSNGRLLQRKLTEPSTSESFSDVFFLLLCCRCCYCPIIFMISSFSHSRKFSSGVSRDVCELTGSSESGVEPAITQFVSNSDAALDSIAISPFLNLYSLFRLFCILNWMNEPTLCLFNVCLLLLRAKSQARSEKEMRRRRQPGARAHRRSLIGRNFSNKSPF